MRLDNKKVLCSIGPKTKYFERLLFSFNKIWFNISAKVCSIDYFIIKIPFFINSSIKQIDGALKNSIILKSTKHF